MFAIVRVVQRVYAVVAFVGFELAFLASGVDDRTLTLFVRPSNGAGSHSLVT